ncbi:MAG TPA: thermonuclease family protein [Pseudolabrys sp.]|nr:thermonuclease family protein [Pseudolabrys sp.]
MALAHLLIAAMLALAPLAAAAESACGGKDLGGGTVFAVRDGRTLLLADGREVRLAAIETPDGARAALAALAQGRTLTLKTGSEASDRYGRVVAFAVPAGAAETLQESLLIAGQARVSARIGTKSCAAALFTREKQARGAHRGLWADPNFAPLPADDYRRLGAETGHFVLVEGKVLSVRTSGATIYVNFGRRFTRDLSLTILRRLRAGFSAAGIEPGTLEGRRIRVRGWLERRRGPIIAVDAPEQIEVIE